MALGGWIKLHRALADHHVASDPASLAVWIHLLMMANHATTRRQINGRVLTLEAGQLITSRKSLAEKTGVQESKVERILSMLKTGQQIEQQCASKFRVISILNWEQYQSGEQQFEQLVNSRRTADEQQMNTPGECKELRELDLVGQQANQPAPERIPYELIFAAYAKQLPTLPQLKLKDEARRKAIKSIWSMKPKFQSVDFFTRYFEYVSKSDWLMGRTDRPWNGCSFDWLMKPANFRKVIEGNYDNEREQNHA